MKYYERRIIMTVKTIFLIFCQNVKALRLSNHLTKEANGAHYGHFP